MNKFTEPRWMPLLDKMFWPIVYILIILVISVLAESAKAQEMIAIEKWRLEKVCKELILLDSLTKDYAEKDSINKDLKKLISTLKSDISNLGGALKESTIQVDLLKTLQAGYIKEAGIWHDAYKQEKKNRFGLSFGINAGYSLDGRAYFGPGVGATYTFYKL